jgi:hypothetical protein
LLRYSASKYALKFYPVADSLLSFFHLIFFPLPTLVVMGLRCTF